MENVGQIEKKRFSLDKNTVIIILLVVSIALNFVIAFFIFYANLIGTARIVSTLNNIQNIAEGRVSVPVQNPDLFLGKKEAKVEFVEYADYQCPYCQQFHTEILPKLKQNFIDTGKIKFYFQDFAFLGQESQDAAIAAKCAAKQGKYFEYHDHLYTHQKGENEGQFNINNLKAFAKELGLKEDEFNACMDSQEFKQVVQTETAIAQGLGVNATPTVFINGLKIEGVASYEVYAQKIESELKK